MNARAVGDRELAESWRASGRNARPPGRSLAVLAGLLAATLGCAFLLSDSSNRPLLWNTLAFATASTALSLPVGGVLAMLLFRTQIAWPRFLHWILTLLLFLPPYLLLAGWDAGWGMQGWAPRWLFPATGWTPLRGWSGALLMQLALGLPWVVFLVGAGLAGVPRDLEELASLDGSDLQVLWRVTRRWWVPSLVSTGLLYWVLVACDITVTDIFQIRTFAEEVYTGFMLGDSLPTIVRRTASGLVLTAGCAVAASWPLVERAEIGFGDSKRPAWRARLGVLRWPVTLLLTLVLGTLLLAPVGNLVYQAGLLVDSVQGERVWSWSFAKVVELMVGSPGRFRDELAWSMLLGQLSGLTALGLAVGCCWWGSRRRWARWLGAIACVLGLATPGPVLALALSSLVNQPGSDLLFYLYDRTIVVAWLALVIRLFPVAYLLTAWKLRSVNRRLADQAALSGVSAARVFWHAVGAPLRDFFLCQWLVLLALAIGDLSATVLATPPGVTTVSVRVFNLVHYGVADQLAGLCLALVLLFGGMTALVIAFSSSSAGREGRTV